MKVEVRKLSSKELVVKLVGEDHTLGNLIAKEALKHPHIKLAAYAIEHPLEGSPVVRLVTDGEVSALQVFREVVTSLKAEASELLKVLESCEELKE
ncbi:MAG: DNA-directed RNA polymerase subunit L [Desulfurococcales archaeon]|nr:DNA-directed RNA polymerase subunit L [Desulfurococcales archaeon]